MIHLRFSLPAGGKPGGKDADRNQKQDGEQAGVRVDQTEALSELAVTCNGAGTHERRGVSLRLQTQRHCSGAALTFHPLTSQTEAITE